MRVVDNAPEDEELLRRELASDEGIGGELEVSWPRVSVSADYKAAVRFGDTLDVFIAVAECKVVRAYHVSLSVSRSSGNLVATGTVVVVRCLMRRGMKPLPVRIPAGISERMKAYQLPIE